MAIFVEDEFAKEVVENIARRFCADIFDRIGVYAVKGDSKAYDIHRHHMSDPSVSDKVKSICILDADSNKNTDDKKGVIKLPGTKKPEAEVFDYVKDNISSLSMLLAAGLHLPPERDGMVAAAVAEIAMSNRDAHLLFNQVGQRCGLIPTPVVSSAFINLWMNGNEATIRPIAEKIRSSL